MELSGRTPGYRGIAIRCPGCAETMTQHALEECEVDVCTACGGIWVDWFDGEVRKVTTEALRAAPPVAPPERTSRNEAVAFGACPRCTRQLARERYAIDGQATGAELLRCEECMGVFVSAAAAETLASLPAEASPPSSERVEVLDPHPWQRLVAVIRRLLGLAAS